MKLLTVLVLLTAVTATPALARQVKSAAGAPKCEMDKLKATTAKKTVPGANGSAPIAPRAT